MAAGFEPHPLVDYWSRHSSIVESNFRLTRSKAVVMMERVAKQHGIRG